MNQTLEVIDKHPWAIIGVSVDWAAYAAAIGNPGVASSTWAKDAASSIQLSNAQVNGAVASTLVEGGADGETAYLENRVTFTDGQRDVYTVRLIIADKIP